MEKKALDLMLFALDNELTFDEQSRLEQALAKSSALRQEQEEFLHLRELLAEMRPEIHRDGSFADVILEEIQNAPQTSFWSDLISLSPKVAAACVLFVLSSLLAIYFWEGNLSSEAIIGVQNLTPEDAFTIQEERVPSKEQQNRGDIKPFTEPDVIKRK